MKNNNFYNITSELEYIRKMVYIRKSIKDFTNSNNEYINKYYYYLTMKNFSLKLQCKNSKLKSKMLENFINFFNVYERLYNFKYISKKYKIFVNVYTLNLNDFKMFYTFK